MSIPILCETSDCPNNGTLINRVAGIEPGGLDLFYESYGDGDPADICPLCRELGIAIDPEEEDH